MGAGLYFNVEIFVPEIHLNKAVFDDFVPESVWIVTREMQLGDNGYTLTNVTYRKMTPQEASQ